MRTSLSLIHLAALLALFAACGTFPCSPFDAGAADIGTDDTAGDAPADVTDPDIAVPDVDQCPPTACVEPGPLECGGGAVVDCAVANDGCVTETLLQCEPGEPCDPVTLTYPATECDLEVDCELGDRICRSDDSYLECALDAEGFRYNLEVACDDGEYVDGESGATCVSDPCASTEE